MRIFLKKYLVHFGKNVGPVVPHMSTSTAKKIHVYDVDTVFMGLTEFDAF